MKHDKDFSVTDSARRRHATTTKGSQGSPAIAAPLRVRLTRASVRRLSTPIVGESTVRDSEVLGLGVRRLASGGRSWIVIFRAERGRGAPHRSIILGPIEALTVEAARRLALDIRASAAAGEDPTEARRAARKARSAPAAASTRTIATYAAALEARGVSDRDNVVSALRRHVLKPLGERRLDAIDRAALIGRVKALFDGGPPGAARSVKAKTSTFFARCLNEGLVVAKPIADYALPRETRVEVVKRARRLLTAVLGAGRMAGHRSSRRFALRRRDT
jgi:hypothetical protein